MCWVPGLADGRFLIDEEILKPQDVRPCGQHWPRAHGLAAPSALRARTGARTAGSAAGSGAAAADGDHVVMLGVNGGPVLVRGHSEPAMALRIAETDSTYVVDCGEGAARHMVLAGVPFSTLRHVFVTHHHSDHVSGYSPLILHGMHGNAPFSKVGFWGPKPMRQMQRSFATMYAPDIASRVGTGSGDVTQRLTSHEYTLPASGIRRIMEDDNVVVHATRVEHGRDIADPYAYRFTIKRSGRSIVFSGDTAPTPNLIELAKDADTLVHECILVEGVEQILKSTDPSRRDALRNHMLTTHTDVTEVPAIAKAAGVKRLVLTHFAPIFPGLDAYLRAAKEGAAKCGFSGEILAPSELESFSV